MRIVLTSAALAFAAACGAPAASENPSITPAAKLAPAEEARLVAVLSYADWCGSCRVLDPKLAGLRADPPEGVHIVTLDYTARDADAFFAAADAAGVGETVRARFEGGVKTGMLLLIDRDDATVIGEIKKDMTEAEIVDTVTTAAAAA